MKELDPSVLYMYFSITMIFILVIVGSIVKNRNKKKIKRKRKSSEATSSIEESPKMMNEINQV